MNSLAVALATDSAATVFLGRNSKVYNSADKLFMLSKRHPIGVMVYNNASLLGIPWETLLKMFRARLGRTEFGSVEEYAAELLKFLDSNDHLFPKDVQYSSYLRMVETLYQGINRGIEFRTLKEIRRGVDEPDREAIARDFIEKSHQQWLAGDDAERLDPKAGSSLAAQGSDKVQKAIDKSFPSLKLSHDDINRLRELAMLVVNKKRILDETRSGLVVAGFGGNEYFPAMHTYELGEVYLGRLKYHHLLTKKIDRETPSVIQPFAQSDMVDTFLGGISPAFKTRIISEFVSLVAQFPETIIDEITDLSVKKREKWKNVMRPLAGALAQELVVELEKYRLRKHIGPVEQAITNLPKNELAHVASSLVNLNSFQKRMSVEQETVGGPVDVAVITKGDGFVWIERKHYFRPELNHQFFRNYGEGAEDEGERYDSKEKEGNEQS